MTKYNVHILVFVLLQFSVVFDTKDLKPSLLSLVLPLYFCLTSVSFDDLSLL